jgi:hypothetical protein
VASPSAVVLFCEIAILVVATLPLGLLVVRVGERVLRRRVELSVAERLVLALYATGGVLYLLAAVPIPIYGSAAIGALLVGGAVGYAFVQLRERGAGVRAFLDFATSRAGALLGVLFAGLLVVELAGIASLTVGNTLDGSVDSLYVNLLLAHHTLPWTLRPYANVGVAYPQSATVWLSLPVLLFNWPIVTAPLALPAFFLAFSVVGAFCLGDRLTRSAGPDASQWMGLLFAGFFGVVASWPRLFVGGSFDFVFCLPLFLVFVGWLVPFVSAPARPWREVVVLALVIGLAAQLSAMAGLTMIILLAGFLLAYREFSPGSIRPWCYRWLAVLGIAALSLGRTLLAVALWFDYPGHVLTPVGNPPPSTPFVTDTLDYRFLNGELNPFVWLKPKLSPFPALSVEIAMLLAIGLAMALFVTFRPTTSFRRFLPGNVARPILTGTVVLLVEAVTLAVGGALNSTTSGLQSVVDIEEVSILLFIFYELLAILPLVAAVEFLRRERATGPAPPQAAVPEAGIVPPSPARLRRRIRGSPALGLAVAIVVGLSLGSGVAVAVVQVPGYISDHIGQLADVSPADLTALEWAGRNLPSCSQVLVAPGSVGQYLPEYASVGIVFPAFPTPVNLSYSLIVQDLDAGLYGNATRSLLLELGITTVLVSGQNSVTYPPFQLAPLQASADFSTLFTAGDVTILEFTAGASASGCLP